MTEKYHLIDIITRRVTLPGFQFDVSAGKVSSERDREEGGDKRIEERSTTTAAAAAIIKNNFHQN